MEAIKVDHREAELGDAERVMLDYAMKLTASPGEMTEADVQSLRREGFDDTAIHDIVQAVALFNYFNRLADGLGIDGEPDWSSAAPTSETKDRLKP